MADYSD